jgi:hypothetical protein
VSDDLLTAAFRVLGTASTAHELELVGRALRTAGDERTLTLMERAGAEIDADAKYRPAYAEVGRIAEAAGADGFTVLDLLVEVTNPDWRRNVRLHDVLRVSDARDI